MRKGIATVIVGIQIILIYTWIFGNINLLTPGGLLVLIVLTLIFLGYQWLFL